MADFNSSLPVRTENAGDVIVKVGDATTPSQQLAIDSSGRVTVLLDDGSGNHITSQASGGQRALDVGINVSGVQIDPRQIRALTSADVVSVVQSTSPWITSDIADGSVTGGTAGTKSLLAGAVYTSSLPTLTTGQQVALQVDSSGRLLVGSIAAALPAGTNNIGKVSIQDSSGNPFSVANPLPVVLSSSAPGTYINSYHTTSGLAAGSSVNQDYSITAAKTMTVRKIWATATGKLKAEIQISPDGTTFTTFWVGLNSTATPNIDIQLDTLAIQETGTGAKIRVILTNDDKSAMDVYSTISGTEA